MASSVNVSVAELVDGAEDADVFACALQFVLVHCPEIGAGEGGGDEGEEGDEAQKEDAEAAAEHLRFGLLVCLFALVFGSFLKIDRRGKNRVSCGLTIPVSRSRLSGIPLFIIMHFTILISCSQREWSLVSGFRTELALVVCVLGSSTSISWYKETRPTHSSLQNCAFWT